MTIAKNIQKSQGEIVIEFIFVIPLLLIFLFFLLDYSHRLSILSIVDEAVYRAVQKASIIPDLDINPSGIDANSEKDKKLETAKSKAIKEGLNFLESTSLVDTSLKQKDSFQTASLFTLAYKERKTTRQAKNMEDTILILLPGDCATVIETQQSICNEINVSNTEDPTISETSPSSLMKRHPIKAVAVVKLTHLLPFWGTSEIVIESYAFREPVVRSDLSSYYEM